MGIFDIDNNIESIDENIRKYKLEQLKSNRYIKFVSTRNDLKYISNPYEGDMAYIPESDEVYIYVNEWIKTL